MSLVQDRCCDSPRFRSLPFVVALVVLLAFVSDAQANDHAEELNRQGKAKIQELDLEGAAKLFREALSLHSDPRYAFNLCYTLEKSGYVHEAEDHCEHAQQSGDESVVYKSTQILKRIAERKAASEESPLPGPPRSQQSEVSSTATLTVPPEKQPKIRYGGFFGFTSASAGGAESVPGVNLGASIIRQTKGRHSFLLTGEFIQRGGEGFRRGFSADEGTLRASATVLFADVSPLVRFAIFRSVYLEGGLNMGIRLYVDSDDLPLKEAAFFHYGYSLGLGIGLPISEHVVDIRFRIINSISNVFDSNDGDNNGSTHGSPVLAVGAGLWW